uniref:Uncharacterized protein n=1 Tax=Knipowitschia caucasica TaxID=637954 RepID=A0AAV2KLP9_KNICA
MLAELDANLYVLKTQRSATAASAEAAVYEAAAVEEKDPLSDLVQILPQDTAQRTSEYVQAHYNDPQQKASVPQPPDTTSNARAPSPPPPASVAPDPVQWYPLPTESNLHNVLFKNEPWGIFVRK